MADITDVQVVAFSNQRARTVADKLAALLPVLTAWQADYAAIGILAKINAAGGANYIADGSDVDGRIRVTGTGILNLKAAIDQIVTAMNVTTVSGVGTTASACVNAVQVNGPPR